MVIDSPAYKKAIQRLWTGKATVYMCGSGHSTPPLAAQSRRNRHLLQSSPAACPTKRSRIRSRLKKRLR